ncbi:uncharacterized protein LOC143360385 [Halictus rubicundus]|uniref:uncharacterized protein LOC143360385 n=1 Tax=Halictus rubicundus TaxID=77578 RepID=UPI00403535A0
MEKRTAAFTFNATYVCTDIRTCVYTYVKPGIIETRKVTFLCVDVDIAENRISSLQIILYRNRNKNIIMYSIIYFIHVRFKRHYASTENNDHLMETCFLIPLLELVIVIVFKLFVQL